ncbi:hypothetical protein F5I97DRAFT_1881947 [Phlebopus sp. FC_14]|nr:hypothetical protein F5I97DRAFT_1881947 [Phlebopus sp. FC_14]
MSGSKLAAVMRHLGELDAAKSELYCADKEEHPKEIPVADTEELIEGYERRANLGRFNLYSTIDKIREAAPRKPMWLTVYNEHLAAESSDEEHCDSGRDDTANAQEKEETTDNNEKPCEDNNQETSDGVTSAENIGDVNDNEASEKEGILSDHESNGDAESLASEYVPPQVEEPPGEDPPEFDLPPPLAESSLSSPFHPSHYPSPWPFIPFANPQPPVLLQKRIPLHLLPQTLYVHDPYKLLCARPLKRDDTPWLSKPDIIHEYQLSLLPRVREQVKEARRKAEEEEDWKSKTLHVYRIAQTKEEEERFEPVIEVPLPPYQRRPTVVEEAHLYLSPTGKLGSGNHSIVYKAEWELPRDVFTEPKFCNVCLKQAIKDEVQKLKKSGKWDEMLRSVGRGPAGFEGGPSERPSDISPHEGPICEEGEVLEREMTTFLCFDEPGPKWMREMDRLFGSSTAEGSVAMDIDAAGKPTPRVPFEDYAIIRINPKLRYQNPCYPETVCPHGLFLGPAPVPRTTRFEVAAKLSVQHDNHLAREAANYQKFPDHFFQHWNGFNIVPPLHDPVPVHALVPQFYGYYTPVVPDEDEDSGYEDASPPPRPYLSPILLLEHCGARIDPEKLSYDDRQECTSLLLRFHKEGWIHDSFAARNILAQKGSPTEFPIDREVAEQLSFRLIDFGRSMKYKDALDAAREEGVALKLFGLQYGACI